MLCIMLLIGGWMEVIIQNDQIYNKYITAPGNNIENI